MVTCEQDLLPDLEGLLVGDRGAGSTCRESQWDCSEEEPSDLKAEWLVTSGKG